MHSAKARSVFVLWVFAPDRLKKTYIISRQLRYLFYITIPYTFLQRQEILLHYEESLVAEIDDPLISRPSIVKDLFGIKLPLRA